MTAKSVLLVVTDQWGRSGQTGQIGQSAPNWTEGTNVSTLHKAEVLALWAVSTGVLIAGYYAVMRRIIAKQTKGEK